MAKKFMKDDAIICIMEDIINGYYPLSLGYSCFIRKYFDKHFGRFRNKETHLFDWLGTSMWSIHKLFEDGFKDAFDSEYYKQIPVSKNGHPIYTHERYYIRALHDNPKDMGVKYNRRLVRLQSLLGSGQHILFMRVEEPLSNRLIPDDLLHYYGEGETHYILKFTDTLLALYKDIRFTILYISSTSDENSVVTHNGIKVVTLSCKQVMHWENCLRVLEQLFSSNRAFLGNALRLN